jgi:hypothetical protein
MEVIGDSETLVYVNLTVLSCGRSVIGELISDTLGVFGSTRIFPRGTESWSNRFSCNKFVSWM